MTKREDTVRLVMAPPGSESSEIEMIFKYRAIDDDKIEFRDGIDFDEKDY